MSSQYIMIGGFLGAGKTTLIQRFAQYLTDKNQTVGLITNDQGAGLVDSAIGRSNRFPCRRFREVVFAAGSIR